MIPISKIIEKRCLECKCVYEPSPKATPAEYPYCFGCNMRQNRELRALEKASSLLESERTLKKKKKVEFLKIWKEGGPVRKNRKIYEVKGGSLCLSC
jgi:hypothetical protein